MAPARNVYSTGDEEHEMNMRSEHYSNNVAELYECALDIYVCVCARMHRVENDLCMCVHAEMLVCVYECATI